MRILILSDIHANQVALDAVFAAAGRYDALWCLGDTIGYGPDPNECASTIKSHADIVINGNHDLACIGEVDLDDFNPDARTANIWNGEQLRPEYHEWLKGLNPMEQIDEYFTIAHASPREPVWEYLLSAEQAEENSTFFETPFCLIGHSHIQFGFRLSSEGHYERFLPSDRRVIDLEYEERMFVNPGSVGQPRDYDPRAAYAIYDTGQGTIRFHRVEYDIARTQRKMAAAHLPVNLIRRLEFGM